MMKRISAVAVAVSMFCAVSAHAAFDNYKVIDANKGEAVFGYYGADDGFGIKVRYGVMENLEVFAANGVATMSSDFVAGVRYQIVPDMLAGFLDLGVDTDDGRKGGMALGVNFTQEFNEMISLGSTVGFGMDFEDETVMNLLIGVELEFKLTDNIALWVGCDVVIEDLGNDDFEFDAAAAFRPALGLTFANGDFSIGFMAGVNFNKHPAEEGADAAGGFGGVEVGIKF